MAKTTTKVGDEKIEIVDVSLLLLGLDKIKKEANRNLGENEGLKKELDLKIDSIVTEKEIKTVNDKVNDLALIISKSPEMENSSEIGIIAKRIELATEELARQHPKEVEELKKETFKKEFVEETKKINPDLSENQLEKIRDYSKLVAENSFGENILDGQENGALEANKHLFGPGRLENAWTDLKQTISFLQKTPEEIRGVKEKYNSIKEGLRDVNLPGNFKEGRSFEKIMAGFNNPSTDQLFSRTKKYLGWADRVDKLTGGWLNKTVANAGQKIVSKIGNQAIQEFATNSLNVIAEQGFQQGFTTILNGVLSGGVNAATTAGTTAAVAGGAGTAAAGAAGAAGTTAAVAGGAGTAAAGAAGAAGTTAAVAGGAAVSATGVGAIVVAALAAVKVVKDVVGKITEKLGISTKKFLEENFGKIGGKVIGGIASIVALPAFLIGSVSTIVIAPLLIIVFGGLFGYQTLQGNLISSLVPPKGASEYVEEVEETPDNGDYIINPGDNISGNIVVPKTPVNFTRQDLINVAMSLKNKIYYQLSGPYNCIGPCPSWGQPIPLADINPKRPQDDHIGVDCSGFIRWVYIQLTGKDVIGGTTRYLDKLSEEKKLEIISENNLKPGDIGWYSGHVALFIGRDKEGNKIFLESWKHKGVNYVSDDIILEREMEDPPSFTKYIRPNVTFYGD